MICTKEALTHYSFLIPTKNEYLGAPVTDAFYTADEVGAIAYFIYDWYIFLLIRCSDISVFDKLSWF